MAAHQRRSVLFVGALATRGLNAALSSGADIVCIDLEDAVPPARKDEGRAALLSILHAVQIPADVELIVRINSLRSMEGIEDVRTLLGRTSAITSLLLPKAETADEIQWAAALIDSAKVQVNLYAIIETPSGLANCEAIAKSHARLKALFFGGFDLSTALGSAMAWEPLLYARSRVVHAAAWAGIDALDSPFPDLTDPAGLDHSCAQAKALGMVGKAAKSANQVAAIKSAFTPTEADVARARKIVEMYRADPSKPLLFDGKLIELPTIKRLERVAAYES